MLSIGAVILETVEPNIRKVTPVTLHIEDKELLKLANAIAEAQMQAEKEAAKAVSQ